MFPKWEGLELVPAKAAYHEMLHLGLDLWDALEVLAFGYECQRSARKEGTREMCVKKGKKTLKVVAVKDYNLTKRQDVWLIVHVGEI
ncbi:MAG: hypothetical protein V1911_03935 [Candidatus Micrarchaeota archaeon]